jgi:hypothetical protein
MSPKLGQQTQQYWVILPTRSSNALQPLGAGPLGTGLPLVTKLNPMSLMRPPSPPELFGAPDPFAGVWGEGAAFTPIAAIAAKRIVSMAFARVSDYTGSRRA